MPKDTGNMSSTYALRTYWNKVLKSNKFKIGDLGLANKLLMLLLLI